MFTDIEGSTRLLQRLGASYPSLLARHHRILRQALAAHHGTEVSTEGDAFFVAFRSVVDAVRAAEQSQRALAGEGWPDGVSVAVRMGIHTGAVELADGDYVGLEVHRAARIASSGHGGQVVLSRASRELLGEDLPPGASIRDLGEHRLKDIDQPEHLYQLVLDGLRADFPPLRTLSARFEILPPEVTSFIGREAQAETVADLLGRTRLLTLTGPGGTGKSRLALQVARRYEDRYPDGVAFVPLAAISRPELVAPTIRQTLGFSEQVEQSAEETIVAGLRDRRMLLVLDNFEQLLPAAGVVARLVAGTEAPRILVTSRAVLRISGEQEYPVPPLGLPPDDGPVDPEAVARSEAVTLFVDRARLVRPDFELDASNARTIALICARLDGLPLAIELAASRIRLLPPDALLARLTRRLDVLRSTAADLEDRQRTLRGAIAWSHDLLGPEERAVFRRLSVFVGGASLEAVEAIVPGPVPGPDGQPGTALEGDPIDQLEALLGHSLVRQAARAGEPRFEMLETIREYGLERLAEAGEAEALAERHARWHLDLVRRLAPVFMAGPESLDAVEAEHDNVRTAVRWAIDRGEVDLAQRAIGALWRFWHLRDHLAEGEHVAREVLAMPGAADVPAAHSRALYALGSVLYWRSDTASARVAYEASLDSARRGGDRQAEAEAHYALGFIHALAKDWAAARQAFRSSGELYEAVGDRVGSLDARYGAAFAESIAGNWSASSEMLDDMIRDYDAQGLGFQSANTRLVHGRTLQRLGDRDRARERMLDGLERAAALGDRTMIAMALRDIASLTGQDGDLTRAMLLTGAAEGLESRIGAEAPKDLINSLDPIGIVRDAGLGEAEIARLLEEGRHLDQAAALELARGGDAGASAAAEGPRRQAYS